MSGRLLTVFGAVALVLVASVVYLVSRNTPVRPVDLAPVPAVLPVETAPAVLGAADAEDPAGLRVEVLSITRVAPQVVEVRVALVNRGRETTLSIGDRLADSPAEAGSLSGSFLDVGGAARYFVLRDAQGEPVCSRDVLAIPGGGRREAWVRFVSPGPSTATAVLRLKGVPGIGPLTLPGEN